MKQFTDKEMVTIANIIDVASQRGIFRARDMEAAGALYKKITAELPKPAQETPKTDEQK